MLSIQIFLKFENVRIAKMQEFAISQIFSILNGENLLEQCSQFCYLNNISHLVVLFVIVAVQEIDCAKESMIYFIGIWKTCNSESLERRKIVN